MNLSCPGCGARYRVGTLVGVGRKVRCPKCEWVFEPPGPAPKSDPPAAERTSTAESRPSTKRKQGAEEGGKRQTRRKPSRTKSAPTQEGCAARLTSALPLLFAAGLLVGGVVMWFLPNAWGSPPEEGVALFVVGLVLSVIGWFMTRAILWPAPKAGPAPTVESMPPWAHRDSWTSACRPLLGPGAMIRAICMFSTITADRYWCLVLTDTHLHLVSPDPTRGLQILQTFPIGKLSSIIRTTWYYPKEWTGGLDWGSTEWQVHPRARFTETYGFEITPATPLAYMSAAVDGVGLMEFATPCRDGFEFADEVAKRAGHSAPAAGAAPSVARELEELARLKSEGILTDADWEQAKRMLLGAPPNKREEAKRALRQLFALLQQGVLSESEFRVKKWEVLGKLG